MSQNQKNQAFKVRLSLKGDTSKSTATTTSTSTSTKKKLQKSQQRTSNHVVEVTPSMTMYDLIKTSYQIFDIPPKSHFVELYSGFPPKLLTIPGNADNNNGNDDNSNNNNNNDRTKVKEKYLAKSFIRGGDNILVKFVPSKQNKTSKKRPLSSITSSGGDITTTTSSSVTEDNKNKNSNSNSNSNNNATTNKRGRPKRAAATAASASFKEVIKEQDRILKKEKSTSTRRSSSRISNRSSNSVAGNHSSINATKKKAAAEARAKAANSRRLASLPGGRKLNDDTCNDDKDTNRITTSMSTSASTSASVASNKVRNKSVPSIFKGLKSEDDISFALLSSINTPGSGKKVNKVLRSAMKRTVEKSYEVSRAVVRCSAIASGDITFISNSEIKDGKGDGKGNSNTIVGGTGTCNDIGTFVVKYPKGIEGHGYYEDQDIHIISIETLKAVIQSVYTAQEGDDDKDDTGTDDTDAGGKEMLRPNNMAQLSPRVFWSLWYHFQDKCQSIEEALELVLPNLSWKFLSRRSRQLSQKAKDNLRQEHQANVDHKEQKMNEDECKYEASVNAIKSVEDAMEKMYDSSNNVESLRARAAQAALHRMTKAESSNTDMKPKWYLETPTEFDIDELRECMLEAIEVENKSISPEQLDACTQYLASSCSIQNWRMLANASCEALNTNLIQSSSFPDIDESVVTAMITAAQQRSMEEIMLEILDGNEDIYHILREDASSSTPQDMTLWYLAPSILLEEAPALKSEELKVNEQSIIDWCGKSQIAIDTLQWLEIYSTCIS